jgi:hypothetical protein
LRKWDLQRRVKEQLLCKKWELRKYQVHNHTCRGPTEHKSCIFGSKRRRGRTPWWWFSIIANGRREEVVFWSFGKFDFGGTLVELTWIFGGTYEELPQVDCVP